MIILSRDDIKNAPEHVREWIVSLYTSGVSTFAPVDDGDVTPDTTPVTPEASAEEKPYEQMTTAEKRAYTRRKNRGKKATEAAEAAETAEAAEAAETPKSAPPEPSQNAEASEAASDPQTETTAEDATKVPKLSDVMTLATDFIKGDKRDTNAPILVRLLKECGVAKVSELEDPAHLTLVAEGIKNADG